MQCFLFAISFIIATIIFMFFSMFNICVSVCTVFFFFVNIVIRFIAILSLKYVSATKFQLLKRSTPSFVAMKGFLAAAPITKQGFLASRSVSGIGPLKSRSRIGRGHAQNIESPYAWDAGRGV